MAKLSDLRVDIALQREGRWVDFGDGIALKIASVSSPDFRRATAAIIEDWYGRNPDKALSAEERKSLLCDAVARFILRDWRGVEDDDGRPIPYTPERGLEVFRDPALEHIYEFVDRQCALERHYRLARKASDLGNSLALSPGTSNGASTPEPSKGSSGEASG